MGEIQAGTTGTSAPRPAGTFSPIAPEWILDCQFVEENAAGLALDALHPQDSFRVNQHLSWCPMCAKLVHETRKTVSYLPFTSTQATPSASAKTNLLDRIKADRLGESNRMPVLPLTTLPASTFDLAESPAPIPAAHGAGSRSHGSSGKKRPRWGVIATPLAAVPLIVALAIVGGWALQTQGELQEQKVAANVLRQDLDSANGQLTLLSSGEKRNWSLIPIESDLGSQAGGQLSTTASTDQFQASLDVWNLPHDADGYDVILETKDGRHFEFSSFMVDSHGDAVDVSFNVPFSLGTLKAIHIKPASDEGSSAQSDSLTPRDVLWTDMLNNLGGSGGTEANARSK